MEGLGQRSWGAMLLLRGLCPCFSTLALEERAGVSAALAQPSHASRTQGAEGPRKHPLGVSLYLPLCTRECGPEGLAAVRPPDP